MVDEIILLQKEVGDLRSEVRELQLIVERLHLADFSRFISSPSLEIIIMETVSAHFGVHVSVLVDKTKDKNQHNRSTANGLRIAIAKEWALIIFRHFFKEYHVSYQSISLAMPWVSTRKYYEATNKLDEVQNIDHPDHKLFRTLVDKVMNNEQVKYQRRVDYRTSEVIGLLC